MHPLQHLQHSCPQSSTQMGKLAKACLHLPESTQRVSRYLRGRNKIPLISSLATKILPAPMLIDGISPSDYPNTLRSPLHTLNVNNTAPKTMKTIKLV